MEPSMCAAGMGVSADRGAATGGTAPSVLSSEERERYARHLLLPGVGLGGQQALAAARVLVVGAGGLGSPVLTYLAAAGVGVLGLVDDDEVDLSNLQRQVVHGTPDLGRPKVDSAADRVQALNPHVTVERHRMRFTAESAAELIARYDVVVDATDNFPARYLLSDACVLVGRPLVWGAVARFDGQVSVWWAGHGPCYRCVFPDPPPPGSVPSCAEGGVLGVLPGVIGTLQAAEVLKLVLGHGEPLLGRMLVYDALAATVGEVRLRRRPGCSVCAPEAGPVVLRDLDDTCQVGGATAGAQRVEAVEEVGARRSLEEAPVGESPLEVSPEVAAALLAGEHPPLLLDVREAMERDIVRLRAPEELWRPLGELRLDPRLPGLAADRDVLVYCRSGVRSLEAVALLRSAGYPRAMNVTGGVLAWRARLDPSLPAY